MPLNQSPVPDEVDTRPTALTYTCLQQAVDWFTTELFDADPPMPSVLVTLQRKANTMGYASHRRFSHSQADNEFTDELAVNPEYFGAIPLLEILQTIAHELCHIWQAHHGRPGRGRYHNREWADKMIEIGLMPSSTGRPGGRQTGQDICDYALEGGAFLSAAKGLLETGFTIPWLDRKLPPRRPSCYQPDYLTADPHPALQKALVPPVERVDAKLNLVEPSTPASTRLQAATGTAAAVPEFTPAPVSKIRFSCPACLTAGKQTNAWGKPTLKIACALHEPPIPMRP